MKKQLSIAIFLPLALAACSSDDGLESNAGADITVSIGEEPSFDGCDSNGDIDNYAWVITDAPPDRADAEGKPLREELDACSFQLESAMLVDDVGTWVVELTVSNDSESASDSVEIVVTE